MPTNVISFEHHQVQRDLRDLAGRVASVTNRPRGPGRGALGVAAADQVEHDLGAGLPGDLLEAGFQILAVVVDALRGTPAAGTPPSLSAPDAAAITLAPISTAMSTAARPRRRRPRTTTQSPGLTGATVRSV